MQTLMDIANAALAQKKHIGKKWTLGILSLGDMKATRYNEKNANAQCAFCNRFDQGRQFQHGEFIKKKYGEGTTDILWRDALWTTRRTQYDYEMIALEFKDKAKNL
jgi:hypothetical protein